ncbi:MAG TPA: hypothetical protein VME69_04035 [Methylocella sp.]|nr:hypothetical protein [Methylocella sp.]
MDRVLIVFFVMVLVGLVLVAVWVLVTSYGTTFEAVEDQATAWIEALLKRVFGT